jgi:hypothetical protein
MMIGFTKIPYGKKDRPLSLVIGLVGDGAIEVTVDHQTQAGPGLGEGAADELILAQDPVFQPGGDFNRGRAVCFFRPAHPFGSTGRGHDDGVGRQLCGKATVRVGDQVVREAFPVKSGQGQAVLDTGVDAGDPDGMGRGIDEHKRLLVAVGAPVSEHARTGGIGCEDGDGTPRKNGVVPAQPGQSGNGPVPA